MDSSNSEAKLRYSDGRFDVLVPGAYVVCAVSNVRIPLEDLKYWSVELQEPYATPGAGLRRSEEGRRAERV